MIRKIFNRRKNSKISIYNTILDLNKNEIKYYSFNEFNHVIVYEAENPGLYEFNFLKQYNYIKMVNVENLIKGLDEFLAGSSTGLEIIREYFKEYTVLESLKGFENYLYSLVNFDENKLVSLSILLMRDSMDFESVKFGIYLTKFYALDNYEKVRYIVMNLGKRPEFVLYVISAIENLNRGDAFIHLLKSIVYDKGEDILREKYDD